LLRNKARVIEIPIIFPDREHGESKLSIQDQIEFLLNIPKLRFRQSAEFIKFCIVGFSGVFVNMSFFILLTRLLSAPIEFASPIAIEFSIISNFALNNIWTFKQRNPDNSFIKRLIQFHMIAGIAGLINYSTLLFLVNNYKVWDIGANLIGILLGTIINYSMNSLWTWKQSKGMAE